MTNATKLQIYKSGEQILFKDPAMKISEQLEDTESHAFPQMIPKAEEL